MAANNDPIYSRTPDIQWQPQFMSAADTTITGTGLGANNLVFTADATNGGYVQKIRLRATNVGNTTATVARIFINNGATTGTAANNVIYDEISLPATTATNAAATANYEVPMNIALPAGYRLYVNLGTASANGWIACAIGGKY